MYKAADNFPPHMSSALWRFEHLNLQITSGSFYLSDKKVARALGFLPVLLEQMTGIKRLWLNFKTFELLKQERNYQVNESMIHVLPFLKSFLRGLYGHISSCSTFRD